MNWLTEVKVEGYLKMVPQLFVQVLFADEEFLEKTGLESLGLMC